MAKEKYPSEKLDKFLLRLPVGLRDQIAALAARRGESMNSEIVWRLQRSIGSLLGDDPDRAEIMQELLMWRVLRSTELDKLRTLEAQSPSKLADKKRLAAEIAEATATIKQCTAQIAHYHHRLDEAAPEN